MIVSYYFMQGIYNYVPATSNVFKVYNVTAIP
jgi:hypothetical protein